MNNTFKELIKNIMLLMYCAATTITLMIITGEETGNVPFALYMLTKMVAIAGAYLLIRFGSCAYVHGCAPGWCYRLAEKIKED